MPKTKSCTAQSLVAKFRAAWDRSRVVSTTSTPQFCSVRISGSSVQPRMIASQRVASSLAMRINSLVVDSRKIPLINSCTIAFMTIAWSVSDT